MDFPLIWQTIILAFTLISPSPTDFGNQHTPVLQCSYFSLLTPPPPKKLNVLISGVGNGPSSPGVTAKRALERLNGCEVRFSEQAEFQSTTKWLQKLKWCNVIVAVYQDSPGTYLTRQMSLAVLMGKPVVRWWIGTDVAMALESSIAAKTAKRFSKILHDQIAVAPHLIEELDTLGINAKFIPSLIDGIDELPPKQEIAGESILVYLPADRLDFYGGQTVEKLIQRFPEINFIIVADDSHSLKKYPNVESLGWIDLNSVWPRIKCLLRITNHDGLPRMIIDALRRNIHVIYSWPLDGCIYARTVEQCSLEITNLKELPNRKPPNSDTPLASLYDPDPAIRFFDLLNNAQSTGPSINNRIMAIWYVVASLISQR